MTSALAVCYTITGGFLRVLLTGVEPVSELLLLNSTSATSAAVESTRVIRMVENHAQPLRCVAVGGYPPPSIELHVATRNVTSHFTFTSSMSLTSGIRGLRHISVLSERWNKEFDVTADDDDTVIKCVAAVRGLKPTVQLLQLHVDCEFLLLLFLSSAMGLSPVDVRCFKHEINKKHKWRLSSVFTALHVAVRPSVCLSVCHTRDP